jgi:amino acid transporter
VFFGYDASAHLAEETHEASEVVAKGMWMATLSSWLLSIPVCTPDHSMTEHS